MASQISAGRKDNDNPLLGILARMASLPLDRGAPLYPPLTDYNIDAPDDLAMEQMILQQRQPEAPQQQQSALRPLASSLAIDLAILQEMCQKAKESYDSLVPIECSHLNKKRIEFIPRLGR